MPPRFAPVKCASKKPMNATRASFSIYSSPSAFRKSGYPLPSGPPSAIGVCGHESADVRGVVSGTEVIEAGFGVAFFAGEVDGGLVAVGAEQGVAEGEAGASFELGWACIGVAQAHGAKPIGVVEIGAAGVGDEVAAASVDFVFALGAVGIDLESPMAGEIIDVIAFAGGVAGVADEAGAVDALAIGVIGVGGEYGAA